MDEKALRKRVLRHAVTFFCRLLDVKLIEGFKVLQVVFCCDSVLWFVVIVYSGTFTSKMSYIQNRHPLKVINQYMLQITNYSHRN